MENFFSVENLILLIMAIVIIVGVIDKIRIAKTSGGKITIQEMLGILLSANGEVSKLLKMAEDSIDVKTLGDKRAFIEDHIMDVVDSANFLTSSQKEIFKDFGADNLAKLIVPDVQKVVAPAPEKLEPSKEHTETVAKIETKPVVEEKKDTAKVVEVTPVIKVSEGTKEVITEKTEAKAEVKPSDDGKTIVK